MPLNIPEETAKQLRAAARDALIDLACRLYNADRIFKPEATKLTGLSRPEFEEELLKRGFPWIRIDWDETYEREFAYIDEIARKARDRDLKKELDAEGPTKPPRSRDSL
jgi:predicted HTH domain antitoxin